MVSVGDKARITKGHPAGYEDTITKMFLAASGDVIYQLGYDFVQCMRDEFEITERATDVHQQYHIGESVLYPCESCEPLRECLVFEAIYAPKDKLRPSVLYHIRAGYADFRIVGQNDLTPVIYSLF